MAFSVILQKSLPDAAWTEGATLSSPPALRSCAAALLDGGLLGRDFALSETTGGVEKRGGVENTLRTCALGASPSFGHLRWGVRGQFTRSVSSAARGSGRLREEYRTRKLFQKVGLVTSVGRFFTLSFRWFRGLNKELAALLFQRRSADDPQSFFTRMPAERVSLLRGAASALRASQPSLPGSLTATHGTKMSPSFVPQNLRFPPLALDIQTTRRKLRGSRGLNCSAASQR